MTDAFIRAFFMILLMEFCSSSQIMLATLVSHSSHKLWTFLGAVSAFLLMCVIAATLGKWLSELKINVNLVSAAILITTGMIFIWKS